MESGCSTVRFNATRGSVLHGLREIADMKQNDLTRIEFPFLLATSLTAETHWQSVTVGA